MFFFALCTLYCQFLCVVLCFSSLCVPSIASFSVLCYVFLHFVYPLLPVSLCCVMFFFALCTLYCQFLCVVLCFSSLCVPSIASFSVLCCVFLHFVYPLLPVSINCLFLIVPLVFSNVYFYG